MGAIADSPQYGRDLRSANKEWKRSKDSSTKWSRGIVPSPGVNLDLATGEALTGSESQQSRVRPRSRWCDTSSDRKNHQNFVKMRASYDPRVGRIRTKLYAKGEITEMSASSTSELPPTPGMPGLIRRMSVTDNFLYSFDRSDTPGKPSTLEVFVKSPTSKQTEKFVAKEYEVLDANGETLKGKRARKNLRARGTGDDETFEDEGFELV